MEWPVLTLRVTFHHLFFFFFSFFLSQSCLKPSSAFLAISSSHFNVYECKKEVWRWLFFVLISPRLCLSPVLFSFVHFIFTLVVILLSWEAWAIVPAWSLTKFFFFSWRLLSVAFPCLLPCKCLNTGYIFNVCAVWLQYGNFHTCVICGK